MRLVGRGGRDSKVDRADTRVEVRPNLSVSGCDSDILRDCCNSLKGGSFVERCDGNPVTTELLSSSVFLPLNLAYDRELFSFLLFIIVNRNRNITGFGESLVAEPRQ